MAAQHLDWSALEYIRWRYEIGEDREGLDKVDRMVSSCPTSFSAHVPGAAAAHRPKKRWFVTRPHMPSAAAFQCTTRPGACLKDLSATMVLQSRS